MMFTEEGLKLKDGTRIPSRKLPSWILRFGIQAFEEFQKMERCNIDMSVWHSTRAGKDGKAVCFACLGGAASLKLFEVPKEKYFTVDGLLTRDDITYGTVKDVITLEVILDCFHNGMVGNVFHRLGLDERVGMTLDRPIPDFYSYVNNTQSEYDEFMAALNTLLTDLEQMGY